MEREVLERLAELGDRFSELTAAVRLLEDRNAVVEALARYHHAHDNKLRDEWMDCFTGDAVYAFKIPDDSEWVFELHGEEVPPFFAEHQRRFPVGSANHMHIEPRVTLAGDSAEVVSRYFTVSSRDGAPALRGTGWYRDRLTRCEDGKWRIAERRAYRDIPRRLPEKNDDRVGVSFTDLKFAPEKKHDVQQ